MSALKPVVKKLDSGYWLVHWGQQFAQWPCHRRCETADVFHGGWDTERLAKEAQRAIDGVLERAAERNDELESWA